MPNGPVTAFPWHHVNMLPFTFSHISSTISYLQFRVYRNVLGMTHVFCETFTKSITVMCTGIVNNPFQQSHVSAYPIFFHLHYLFGRGMHHNKDSNEIDNYTKYGEPLASSWNLSFLSISLNLQQYLTRVYKRTWCNCIITRSTSDDCKHDDIMTWQRLSHYWYFVRRIHRRTI